MLVLGSVKWLKWDVILSIFVEKTFDESKKPNISEVFWGTQKDQALESKHNKQIRSNESLKFFESFHFCFTKVQRKIIPIFNRKCSHVNLGGELGHQETTKIPHLEESRNLDTRRVPDIERAFLHPINWRIGSQNETQA